MKEGERTNTVNYMDLERDKRPQKGGWAPGMYTNICAVCRGDFIGDKRAIICADCAYKKG